MQKMNAEPGDVGEKGYTSKNGTIGDKVKDYKSITQFSVLHNLLHKLQGMKGMEGIAGVTGQKGMKGEKGFKSLMVNDQD